jgi:hypothetical protein
MELDHRATALASSPIGHPAVVLALIVAAVLMMPAPADARPTADCRKIVREFHCSFGNQDDFVWEHPAAQRRHVRACLARIKMPGCV